MNRTEIYMPRILAHEGGFIDHPRDPGGATNRGVTIGTLRKLGIDKDGDGDSDLVDLRQITAKDAAAVFKRFYADPVQADLLPAGLDYAMTDFAVNSGPSRAAAHLQRILGVNADGNIGPKTLAAVASKNTVDLINLLCDSRLKFMRNLGTWPDFGKGWTARVNAVRAGAIRDATGVIPVFDHVQKPPKTEHVAPVASTKPQSVNTSSFWARIIAAIFKGK